MRKLKDLLSAESYQDMTDEEIDAIIDYKCDLARQTGETTAQRSALEETLTRMQEVDARSRANAEAMFAKACARRPAFRRVDDGEER